MRSFIIASILILAAGCALHKKPIASVGQRLPRQGDEIMVCGQLFRTGAPVVLWTDPGGYDAYRTERRFAPMEKSSYEATTQETQMKQGTVQAPNRYSLRTKRLSSEEAEKVRGGGWPLPLAQDKIDQLVLHFDACGASRQCFNILHDHRGLSIHFMLDVDGTIYQTLDVKECAWHATKANDRSVGVEIANIGAYPADGKSAVFSEWYRKEPTGRTRMVLPAWMNQGWIRTPNFVGRPARDEPVVAEIQGRTYRMYDLTPQQYDSLIKLTAALCTVLPRINCDDPRDENGNLIAHALPDAQYEQYHGLLGHYHVQANKQDPGPALQWDKVVNGAVVLMGKPARPPGDILNNPKQTVAKK